MNDERHVISQVRAALDESVARLDGTTRSRLASARARALEPRRRSYRWWLMPAGGAVFASLMASVLWLGGPTMSPEQQVPPLAVTDFELLTSPDNLELIEEHDFYRWLEAEGMNAG